jgi:hypothetical protein
MKVQDALTTANGQALNELIDLRRIAQHKISALQDKERKLFKLSLVKVSELNVLEPKPQKLQQR